MNSSPHNPFVRTSAQQEIETSIYESAWRDDELHYSGSGILHVSEQMAAYRNKGGDGTEAGQQPRLNRERDLWKGCQP